MYSQNEKSLIWLTMFNELSLLKMKKLINLFPSPASLYENFHTCKSKIVDIVGEETFSKMLSMRGNVLLSYITNLNNNKIICLTAESENYPEKLIHLEEKPLVLFCKGDISLLKTKSIAIVGTRLPSSYGRIVTENFAKSLAKSGLTIISGLAAGIDKISHEQAMANGGKTIAVLGGGFDNIYPAMNKNLADEIAEKALLITEYRPSVSPTQYSFPFRNRIIAALSDGVLITEAGEKSGALHTKNYALEYGKEIFVIPGNINNAKSKGTNRIIKSMQGTCVTSPEDILLKLNIDIQKIPVQNIIQIQTTMTEKLILSALEDGEKSLENLHEITKLETKTLNSCLTILQIHGLIRKLPGNMYSL